MCQTSVHKPYGYTQDPLNLTPEQISTTAPLHASPPVTVSLEISKLTESTFCLQEKFLLSDSKIYKNPSASGASLFKQLHKATKHLTQSSNQNVLPGKKLQGTSKLVTWNMQGASNFAIAKSFLDIYKPALLLLQETK